jgi:hypothetical protein
MLDQLSRHFAIEPQRDHQAASLVSPSQSSTRSRKCTADYGTREDADYNLRQACGRERSAGPRVPPGAENSEEKMNGLLLGEPTSSATALANPFGVSGSSPRSPGFIG